MSPETPAATPAPPSRIEVAIARSELRLAALEALTRMGMALANDITERAINAPYHPEMKHDAGKSFAAVSRAVRLTLAAETRVDDRILALCKGETAEPRALARSSTDADAMASASVGAGASDDDRPERSGDARRERDRETPDPDESSWTLDRSCSRRGEDDADNLVQDDDPLPYVEKIWADLDICPALKSRHRMPTAAAEVSAFVAAPSGIRPDPPP